MKRRRQNVLEFTVLGLLAEQPMHGYELRKRLNLVLGSFRAISYGSLYPCLKDLEARGLIAPVGTPAFPQLTTSKRARISYALTTEGHAYFAEQLEDIGPDALEDEGFAAHFAFFAAARSEIRVRILDGRRARLLERITELQRAQEQADARGDVYVTALQHHNVKSLESEVDWLSSLIEKERTKGK